MWTPQDFIRPHIVTMPAYEPILPFEVLSQQLGRSPSEIVKLDANENPYGPLPAVQQALANLTYAHIYPDPTSEALRHALADWLKMPAENLLAGAGADELIDLTMRLFLEPGDVLLNCPPTFGMYAFDGDLNAGRVINVPRRADFSLDMEGIEQAVREYCPKLLFLASPNNPDGSLIAPEQLERLLELPLMLVLDEAYIEFASAGHSWIQQVPQRSNLIVLRTLSKWAGLAGLRVGYGAFPSVLLPHLWKIKQPYTVSVAASAAALAALAHPAELSTVGQRILAERARLFGLLQDVPYLRPLPSQANFILCQVLGRDAGELKRALAEQAGVLVRYFNKPGLQNFIRISVGLSAHTDRLLNALYALV